MLDILPCSPHAVCTTSSTSCSQSGRRVTQSCNTAERESNPTETVDGRGNRVPAPTFWRRCTFASEQGGPFGDFLFLNFCGARRRRAPNRLQLGRVTATLANGSGVPLRHLEHSDPTNSRRQAHKLSTVSRAHDGGISKVHTLAQFTTFHHSSMKLPRRYWCSK